LRSSQPSFLYHRRKPGPKTRILSNSLSSSSKLPKAAPAFRPPLQGYHFAATATKSSFPLASSSHSKNMLQRLALEFLFPLSHHCVSLLCFSATFPVASPLCFPPAPG
jgi:hypothetical protein